MTTPSGDTVDPGAIRARYTEILERVRAAAARSAHRQPVTLIAVSKVHPPEAIQALYEAGHRDFGENYVQELCAKAEWCRERGLDGIRWHFIGHLQTNKVKQLLPHVAVLHTLDSLRLAEELAKRWPQAGREGRLAALLEVNVDAEAGKAGVAPEEAPGLAATIARLGAASGGAPVIDLRGLMCIPAPASGASGEAFARLRELELRCRPATAGWLSMGMTQDFERAIAEGATHVRVGTAIFGSRR